MTLLITLIIAAITYGTPLLFGTLGEILTEKSGNLNLGVEGIMFMGGAFGLGGVFYYEKIASSPNGFVAIFIGLLFAEKNVEKRGFAAAVDADKADMIPGFDFKGYVFKKNSGNKRFF